MAASAAYVNITAVPAASKNQTENVQFSNISATTAAFELRGGVYTIDALFTGAGSVTLQRLGPDGSTYLTAATAIFMTAQVLWLTRRTEPAVST